MASPLGVLALGPNTLGQSGIPERVYGTATLSVTDKYG